MNYVYDTVYVVNWVKCKQNYITFTLKYFKYNI